MSEVPLAIEDCRGKQLAKVWPAILDRSGRFRVKVPGVGGKRGFEMR